MNKVTLALALLLLLPTAHAEQRTVTLAVEKMSCAACPYIVKQTLTRLPGVESAEVSYKTRKARVIFDDTKIGVNELTSATMDLGFPSRLIQQGN